MENLLDDIPVLNLNSDGSAPEERLKRPKDLRQIHVRYRDDDQANAYNRHLQQDLLDGGLPYDSQNLAENGVDATNLNFGGAEKKLERARRPYYKLIQSPETLVVTPTLFGSADERNQWEEILAEEITRTIRGTDGFAFQNSKLCDRFIWDGVGFAYWTDSVDFRWRAGGLGQFFFERGSVPIETEHEVITVSEGFQVTRLYGYIKDKDAAKRNGWNPEAVARAIQKANSADSNFMDWEQWSQQVKNNDLSMERGTRVKAVHGFVKEFDGTVSHYITTEDACGPEDEEKWLYVKRGNIKKARTRPYESMSSALVMFPYGLGTNSTIHGIRGLGYKIYEFEHQANRSTCRLIDQSMLSSSIILQAKTETAYGSAGYQMVGNAAMLAPDIDISSVAMPDLQKSVLPALDTMERLGNERISGYTSEGVLDGDQRKTKYEIQAGLEQSAALSDVEQDFFFMPLERTLREAIRRLSWEHYMESDPGGPEVIALRQRLESRGVPLEALYQLDIGAIKVIRLIGAGSAAAKTLSLQRMAEVYPRLDDVGKDNYDRDIIVDAVGTANADRYKPINLKPRTTEDTKIAILENEDLLEGKEIPVLSSERHLVHAREHVKPLLELLEAYQSRQLEEEGALAQAAMQNQLLFIHTQEHVSAIDGDPATLQEAAAFRQLLQQVGEVINNGLKEAERLAEQAAQEGNEEGAAGGPTAEDFMAVEESREKLRQSQEAHDLKLELERQSAQQKMAINDALTANKIQNNQRLTASKAVTSAAAARKKPKGGDKAKK